MSRARKRVRRAKWRRQVARFIVKSGACHASIRGPIAGIFERNVQGVMDGQTFDVRHVRDAALTMLREAEQHGPVFEDWARSLGMGPENCEPGAFGCVDQTRICGWSFDGQRMEAARDDGQWRDLRFGQRFGLLDEGVIGCGDTMRTIRETSASFWDGIVRIEHPVMCGGYPGDLARRPDCPTPPWAPMWRQRVRLARRVLDALKGQPDACRGCSGTMLSPIGFEVDCIERGFGMGVNRLVAAVDRASPGREFSFVRPPDVPAIGSVGRMAHVMTQPEIRVEGLDDLLSCSHCRGTGRNLHGTLAPVPIAPQLRTKVADSHAAGVWRGPVEPWWSEFARREDWKKWDHETRVLGRGEHRSAADLGEPAMGFTGMRANVAAHGYQPGDLIRVRGYGRARWAPRSTHEARRSMYEVPLTPGFSGPRRRVQWSQDDLVPRWRRGEMVNERRTFRREAGRAIMEPMPGSARAIEARVFRVPSVTSVQVVARPMRQVEVIVAGGSDEQVARAIYDQVLAGVQTIGETLVEVETTWMPVPIRFSRPEQVQARADRATYDPIAPSGSGSHYR